MARPRSVSDRAILDATLALLHDTGPDTLTLAAVGKATGLSAATIVQRYGTKAALIKTALLHAWSAIEEQTAEADRTLPESPDGAIALLISLSATPRAPVPNVSGLLLLREAVRDPDLSMRAVAWGRALARALGRRLTSDPLRQQWLGRLMVSQWQGARLWSAVARDPDPADTIREELRIWCAATLTAKTDRAGAE